MVNVTNYETCCILLGHKRTQLQNSLSLPSIQQGNVSITFIDLIIFLYITKNCYYGGNECIYFSVVRRRRMNPIEKFGPSRSALNHQMNDKENISRKNPDNDKEYVPRRLIPELQTERSNFTLCAFIFYNLILFR